MTVGRWFLAVSLVALGVQNFYFKGDLKGLQLTPEWLPAHTVFAYLMGAVLVAGGLSIAIQWKTRWGVVFLAAVFLIGLLLIRVPRLGLSVHDISQRTVLFETITIGCGAWLVADRGSSVARVLIGISIVIFGVDHLEIPVFIASLIPAWMPGKLFLAWFTGFAMIAAGACIIIRWQMRIAAIMLGLMFFLWVALLHGPRVAASPHNPDEWNSAFVALAFCGVCWILAE